MDWILDHLQYVIAFAAAIAFWLNKRRERTDLEREAEAQLSQPEVDRTELDDVERARRIQEEIRRKIAERRTLPPVARPVVIEEWSQPRTASMEPPVIAERDFDDGAAIREQQRQLQEKLRLVEVTRERAVRIRAGMNSPSKPVSKARHMPVAGPGSSLRNIPDLRRAIVLREILGPPKGLQG